MKLRLARKDEHSDGEEAVEAASDDVHAEAQQFEADWWGDCTTTYGEETKQLTYARLMGLSALEIDGRRPIYDLGGSSVLDIGGGPVSILLKCINRGASYVVDPCQYPDWVLGRYELAGIEFRRETGEQFAGQNFDEAWIYNCLQHVVDPEALILNAKSMSKRLRIFEWIEKEVNIGHPHTLYAHDLNVWIGGVGEVGVVNENGCYGLAYWGSFDL